MGRYKANRIVARVIGELTIIFYNSSSIYIYPCSLEQQGYIFHKYFAPTGTYTRNWKNFRNRIWKAKYLDFGICCRIAVECGVMSKGAVAPPNLKAKPLEIRFGEWAIWGLGV